MAVHWGEGERCFEGGGQLCLVGFGGLSFAGEGLIWFVSVFELVVRFVSGVTHILKLDSHYQSDLCLSHL